MDDNKKFWQTYAPIYSRFMKSADAAYVEVVKRAKKYLKKDMEVLELACGTGIFSYMLAGEVNTWEATDFSENMIAEAKKAQKNHEKVEGLSFCVQDATNLPYKEESFDAVMIANALHIMPQPEKALAEIVRVLKPGGLLLAPTFTHGEGMGFALRNGLIGLFGFKAYLKPTNAEFAKYIADKGFEMLEHGSVGSKIAPMCCMIARKKS